MSARWKHRRQQVHGQHFTIVSTCFVESTYGMLEHSSIDAYAKYAVTHIYLIHRPTITAKRWLSSFHLADCTHIRPSPLLVSHIAIPIHDHCHQKSSSQSASLALTLLALPLRLNPNAAASATSSFFVIITGVGTVLLTWTLTFLRTANRSWTYCP